MFRVGKYEEFYVERYEPFSSKISTGYGKIFPLHTFAC